MNKAVTGNRKVQIGLLTVIMMLQLIVASYFCTQKQGFHYDEYYSYYSSNVTYGLVPTDREWKDTEEIRSEFVVGRGEGFNYEMVKLMQTYDVHPPLYYFLLHTVCSFFPGVFSKWFGLGLNLLFFAIAFPLFAKISYELFRGDFRITFLSCLLFGFQPGILSGITFIRMYMLLLVWCLAITCRHIPFWREGIKLTPGRAITLLLLTAAGFLTHYYFAVFLFFLAAFTCLYHWWREKNLKASLAYGSCILGGMALALLFYPSALSHIFRGYRGTEATAAFFDLSNTLLRLRFFGGLMNRSVFGGCLPILLLFLASIFILSLMKKEGQPLKTGKVKRFPAENPGLFCLLTVTPGYFFAVAKTALLNAEEANRYELPVYGFWLLIILALLDYGGKALPKPKRITLAAAGLILGFQFFALAHGEVQFLYPEDRENVEWAARHRKEVILYLYNPSNLWMIWDEAEELMQYERIYFVSLADTSPLTENSLLTADRVYVYASRMEEAQRMLEELSRDNKKLSEKEKIRELLYCDLYCLE